MDRSKWKKLYNAHAQDRELECGPMPNVMVALPNIGGAPPCAERCSIAVQ